MSCALQPVTWIDAATLRAWLGDGAELALIDAREGGPFSREHLLTASSLPLSQLEVRAPLLVPRRTVRVVVMDADGIAGGEAERAAALLLRHGYGEDVVRGILGENWLRVASAVWR